MEYNCIKINDLPNLCRICLLSKLNMMPYKALDMCNLIVSYIGVKMEENDLFPSLICNECKNLVDQLIRFKSQCVKSNEILMKLLSKAGFNYNDKCPDYGSSKFTVCNEESNGPDSVQGVTNIEFDDNIDSCKSREQSDEEGDDSKHILEENEVEEGEDSDDMSLAKRIRRKVRATNHRRRNNRGIDLMECEVCYKFVSQKRYKVHLRTHKPKLYKCDICNEEFHRPSYVAKHREFVHKLKESVNCPVCNKTFRIQAQIDLHTQKFHKKKKQCDVCGKIFIKNSHLVRHKLTHEYREKTIPCSMCSQMFIRKDYLDVHFKKFHSGVPLVRPFCNLCQKSVSNLEKHNLLTHTADRPFKCEMCGKQFARDYLLTEHIKNHKKNKQERKFLCNLCGKGFICPADLKVHMVSHSDVRAFECNMCHKKYKLAKGLKQHMKRHSNERPFCCEYCPKAFFTKEHLKRHIRTHTGEKPYICQICSKPFSSSSRLMSHMKVHALCPS